MNKPDGIHGLTAENILTAFPVALQGDSRAAALAEITARLLVQRPAEISQLCIYPRVMELPEKLLDILAYDFKVDWWDPDYTLEEKRRTLADSWRVHKILGTKAAVETALRAIYPKANVLEWFEYEGGKPYHFKLDIDLTGEVSDQTRPWRALERVNFYKSLRSHVDEIVFTIVLPPATLRVGMEAGLQAWTGIPLEPDTYDFQDTLHLGGSFGSAHEIGVPNEPDNFRFRDTVHAGGQVSSRVELPIPEDTVQPTATTILRTGGVCTIISNLSTDRAMDTSSVHARLNSAQPLDAAIAESRGE